MTDDSRKWLNAADCAARTGLTIRALRVYEREGLLKPGRAANGWRRYGPDDLLRLNTISVLKALGLTLAQIRKLDQFLDLFNHRSAPSKVLTPPRLLAATARLLARGGCDRRALLGEVGGLIAQDARRKRLARHPRYVRHEASIDAGPTEVEDDDAVGLR